jgi:hypothetical protein
MYIQMDTWMFRLCKGIILSEGGMHIEEPCDQTDAEPALASAPPMAKPELWIVPEASNTDPLLLAGMQIKAPLQGLQGPCPDIIPLGSLYFEFKQYKK